MGPYLIIKLNILLYTFSEALLRGIVSAVSFFFFEVSKESLGDCIIMGMPRCGERLLYAGLLQQGYKGC